MTVVDMARATIDFLFTDTLVWVYAAIGGVCDYLNQLRSGKKRWSAVGCVLHISTACFFGWMLSRFTTGLGYSPDIVGAAAGMGGFLGTRVAEIAQSILKKGEE